MTSLLTIKDVKNFIYEAILEGTNNCTLNREQTKEFFNISDFQLDEYIKKGLPWYGSKSRKKFSKRQVRKWLFENSIENERLRDV